MNNKFSIFYNLDWVELEPDPNRIRSRLQISSPAALKKAASDRLSLCNTGRNISFLSGTFQMPDTRMSVVCYNAIC